ncbi:MAG: TetR/AcrR family transcriptional regulator [Polyangiaceae bacterium]
MARATKRSPANAELPPRLKPKKRPQQERSRALVDAIVAAAERVLTERGWDAMSMKEVGAVAGVSPGSLYQYFPDKASLVAEIVERQSKRELEHQFIHAASLSPTSSIEEVLASMVRAALKFQELEGPLMRATLAAMPHLGRHAALVERVRSVATGLRSVMAARAPELDDRELDLSTHVLVNAIHALTHDGVLPRPAWLDSAELERAITRLVRGWLRSSARGDPTP